MIVNAHDSTKYLDAAVARIVPVLKFSDFESEKRLRMIIDQMIGSDAAKEFGDSLVRRLGEEVAGVPSS